MLLGNEDIGNGPLVVCGGEEVGGETAQYLAERNPDVTILEMMPDILNDMGMTRTALIKMLHDSDVKIMTGCKGEKITEKEVFFQSISGEKCSAPADTGYISVWI